MFGAQIASVQLMETLLQQRNPTMRRMTLQTQPEKHHRLLYTSEVSPDSDWQRVHASYSAFQQQHPQRTWLLIRDARMLKDLYA